MKKTNLVASALVSLVAFNSFGQNTFPSSGNVGIGTSSPIANFNFSPVLHINGSRPTLSLTPTGANGLATIQFKGVSTNSEYHMNFYDNATNSELAFGCYQSTGPILSLRGNGNVGIGTSNASDKLYVSSGNIRIDADRVFSIDPGSTFYEYNSGSRFPRNGIGWVNQYSAGPFPGRGIYQYISGEKGIRFLQVVFNKLLWRMGFWQLQKENFMNYIQMGTYT